MGFFNLEKKSDLVHCQYIGHYAIVFILRIFVSVRLIYSHFTTRTLFTLLWHHNQNFLCFLLLPVHLLYFSEKIKSTHKSKTTESQLKLKVIYDKGLKKYHTWTLFFLQKINSLIYYSLTKHNRLTFWVSQSQV